MSIDEIYHLVAPDMEQVNNCIQARLHSEVALIDQIGAYIVNSGGKRLRPIIHLLATRAYGYQDNQHIDLAAIIEFIHTATLLHDDVVDGSQLRRGEATANNLWGNEASVLVGDFLYSRAFQMMVEIGRMEVMDIMADATNTIAEGEVLQLLNCHDPDTTETRYLEVIHSKTAKLFESAARLGAVLNGRSEADEQAMADFGMHLGCAFQLVDDVLDYTADSNALGKNVGDDLAEGKPTLPLIHAMRHGTPEQAAIIRTSIEVGGLDQIDVILQTIESTGAIDYTARCAKTEADKAIETLGNVPESEYKTALIALAHFAVNRNY
ncbi:MAG: octaprenyl diphosphate synthase [Proteobacteria bacterium]|jgi:octaprenyl-diphosphate synthase|nr:octaprenyl diphosphate synthase [Pseudomonadota bacterium]